MYFSRCAAYAALHYPERPPGQGSGEALKGGSSLGCLADCIVDTMRLDSVLISDAVDQKCVQFLQDNGISVTYKTKMPLDELLKEVQVRKICGVFNFLIELLANSPNKRLLVTFKLFKKQIKY
jgi:hypothetical protein